ncbi:MAG: hypothetical protein C5B49_06020 [Bdellovibrio sp.]|nr:MAG: hypothetical protein C5B49_06020 [Bdellovibrio sp.]
MADKSNVVAKYSVMGVLFGGLFPIIAIVEESITTGRTVMTVLEHPTFLLMIIWTAPFFLGLFSYFIGKKQQRILIVNREIQARLESALQLERERLSKANQQIVISAQLASLGELAGQVAHEINTPLGAIVLTTQSLIKKMKTSPLHPDEIAPKLQLILQISDKMARIIQSMRRLASQGANENFSEVIVKDLTADVILLNEGRFKKSSIDFTVVDEFPPNMRIQCRPSEISQVLVNLLKNAHNAVRTFETKWVRLEIRKKDDFAEFAVVDSGPGIPKEYIEKIFLPNFTTKSLNEGTGLGLSISKKLIEQHRGRIQFQREAVNTTFVVQIPINQTDGLTELRD